MCVAFYPTIPTNTHHRYTNSFCPRIYNGTPPFGMQIRHTDENAKALFLIFFICEKLVVWLFSVLSVHRPPSVSYTTPPYVGVAVCVPSQCVQNLNAKYCTHIGGRLCRSSPGYMIKRSCCYITGPIRYIHGVHTHGAMCITACYLYICENSV